MSVKILNKQGEKGKNYYVMRTIPNYIYRNTGLVCSKNLWHQVT
jgi:hypothetical protein